MPKTPKKKPVGRPSKYKKEFCQKLIDHFSEGFSFESFGADVGVSKETLYTWTEKHPDFLDAKKRGTSLCLKFWEDMGIKGTRGLIPGFNTGTWIFNMKNRFQWRDKTEVEHSAKDEIKIVVDKEDMEM